MGFLPKDEKGKTLLGDEGNPQLQYPSMLKEDEAHPDDFITDWDEAEQILRDSWGGNYEKNMTQAKSVVKLFGTPQDQENAEKMAIFNDPKMIKEIHQIAKDFREMIKDTPPSMQEAQLRGATAKARAAFRRVLWENHHRLIRVRERLGMGGLEIR